MNSLYIGIGTAIILALVTALIGPFLVDWGQWRAVFEREATAIVGLPVKVLGDVEARLLPSPRIRFGDMVIGDIERPLARVGRFDLELEAAPLLKGERRIAAMVFDRPIVEVAIDAAGRPVWPKTATAGAAPETVSIEAARVVDGRISLFDERSGGRVTVERLGLAATASSLVGPWKIDGDGEVDGRRLVLHLVGGGGARGITVKGSGGFAEAATLTGEATIGGEPAQPRLSGRVAVERPGRDGLPARRFAAGFAGDLDGVALDEVAVAIGPVEREARLTGTGRLRLGRAPRLDLVLAARQIDVDRASGATASPAALAAGAGDLLARMGAEGAFGPGGRVEASLDGLVIGGAVLGDVRLVGTFGAGALAIEEARADLPGGARLAATGRLDLGARPMLVGEGSLDVDDPVALTAWWRGQAAGEETVPSASLAGRFAIATDRIAGDDLRLTFGGATFGGRFEQTVGGGTRAALAGDRLDLATLRVPAERLAAAMVGAGGAIDLDLDFGRVDVGGAIVRGVAIGGRVSASEVAIERLAIGDLAGARLAGAGRIVRPTTAPDGRIDLRLTAERPERAAAVVAALLGGGEDLPAMAAAFGPLDLGLHLTGSAGAGEAGLRLGLDGRAAGGRLDGEVVWRGRLEAPGEAEIRGSLRLTEGLSAALTSMAGERPQAASLTLTAEGGVGRGVRVVGGGRIGETGGSIDAVVAAAAGGLSAEGTIAVEAADAPWLARAAGRPGLAFERRLPIRLRAEGRASRAAIEARAFEATIGETALSGRIAARLEAPGRSIGGDLRFGRLEGEAALDGVAGLVGSPIATAAAVDLGVTVERLEFGTTATVEAVTARLRPTAGTVRIEEMRGRFAGGGLGGAITVLGRSDGTIGASGRLTLDGAATAPPQGVAGLAARIGGAIDFEAGRLDGLALGVLDGHGTVRLDDLRLVGLDLAAFGRDGGGEEATTAAAARRLSAPIAGGETALGTVTTAVRLEGGALTSSRMVVETPAGRLAGRFSVVLADGGLDGDVVVEAGGAAADRLVSAGSRVRPVYGLTLGGTVAAARVAVDAAPLERHLDLFRLERDLEQAETMRQDMLERARFSRLLRRLEEKRREEEAAAAAAAAAEAAAIMGGGGVAPAVKAGGAPAGVAGASGLPPLPPPIRIAPAPPVAPP